MRCVCLANNVVGLEVVKYLSQRDGDEIVLLVINEAPKQRLTEEIIAASGVAPSNVLSAGGLNQVKSLQRIKELEPDCAVSAFFGHILRQSFLDLFPNGVVNLHTSWLPFNRGVNPNVWSIVDKTPAGATMHLVDEGVDTGAILAQVKVDVDPADTAKSLNEKLILAMVLLFKEHWPKFANGELDARPQDSSIATSHQANDLPAIQQIDLDQTFRAEDLINVLRACTYPPYQGAHFVTNGKKYFLSLSIEPEQ